MCVRVTQQIEYVMSKVWFARLQFQFRRWIFMNAVGIDVSKGKSTVAVLRAYGEVVASPLLTPKVN
jgi:hypothetical protein